jgi:pilus assembly protein CpaE
MDPDSPIPGALSVTVIGPDLSRRQSIVGALNSCAVGPIREFTSYPAGLEDLPQMLAKNYDVILVDLDSDPEYALDVVESVFAAGSATVMVYSGQTDRELVVSSMRAGAREFLTLPISTADLSDALARVSVRQPASVQQAKFTPRKLFTFLGAKGGCGVTTISANFAVALAQESGQKTLLIDLGLPLGDAAINLGMVAAYSVTNALRDPDRLDSSFLASLLATHSSGLYVLSAPGDFANQSPVSLHALDKLLSVARHNFRYVVVDAGSRIDLRESSLFEDAATIYLVTQVGVSELRNSNRMISHFFTARGHRLQIILNRYLPHALLFDDEHVTKALTRPAQWKIPNDFDTARRTQNTATALVLEDSPISRAIRQMARAACGLPAQQEKKKVFSFFG